MPAYNGEKFIAAAIQCVLEQSFRDLTLLISDNASTDATEEICRSFAAQDDRIVYLRQQQNLGATANYNFVAEQASSEYFKWHSCNDLLSKDMIGNCVSVLDSNYEAALVYAKTCLFNESIADAKTYNQDPLADQSDALQRFMHVVDDMALNNIMNGVLRLDMLRRTSMLREFYFADRTMMAELALQGKLLEDPVSRFYRRMDEESATHMKKADEVIKHFNPSWKRPLPFTNWRVYGSFLAGLWASNIGIVPAVKGSLKVARRAWWGKGDLLADIRDFSRYSLVGLKHKAGR
ncbi:MAG TPA: glycosyltransferase family 2 protein [Woeseiaceae bacterium]|nr:glycosyltransferase family 2 protein [Woeseiaceae bacterium]